MVHILTIFKETGEMYVPASCVMQLVVKPSVVSYLLIVTTALFLFILSFSTQSYNT